MEELVHLLHSTEHLKTSRLRKGFIVRGRSAGGIGQRDLMLGVVVSFSQLFPVNLDLRSKEFP